MTHRWPLASGARSDVGGYLVEHGWLDADEPVVRVEVAGPGNMNLVCRVVTARRSLIVKQGRPFVEKYPHIAAPAGRTATEAQWYALAGSQPALARRMPELVGVDEVDQVLVLSDLGRGADCSGLYAGDRLGDDQLEVLVGWLATLHRAFRDDPAASRQDNRPMRLLNHEHIFEVPFSPDNGLDLDAVTPGLGARAATVRGDRPFLTALARLGAVYLGSEPVGATLLHGDFYPGSWIAGRDGPYVIDPEFGFYGRAEIDVGVLLAHLRLSGQPDEICDQVLAWYGAAVSPDERAGVGGTGSPLDANLAWGFAGAEVIRRLLGVAQLPLDADLAVKDRWLEQAVAWVRAA